MGAVLRQHLLGGLGGEGEVAVEELFEAREDALLFSAVAAVGIEAGYRGKDFGDRGSRSGNLAVTECSCNELFRSFSI